jgi:hypothetical protein
MSNKNNDTFSSKEKEFVMELTKGLTVQEQLKAFCKTVDLAPLEENIDFIVDTFNKTHSVVEVGSKSLIAEQKQDHKGNTFYSFLSVQQKRQLYNWLTFKYSQGSKDKQANCFDLWSKSPDCNYYQGVIFDPSNNSSSIYLNLWRGFNVDAVEGDDKLDRIMSHLHNVVCNGNQDHFYYLLAWMAQIIQQPEKKTGVCLVLKSDSRGTGKSTVSVLLERMLGEYAMRVQDSKHLMGAFNSHLANKLLITLEEAFWAGSNKDAGKFRTLITESTLTLEAKGRDAFEIDSYHRYLLCTNNAWVVPATQNERRFFTLEVSEDKAQDKEYFTALYRDINSNKAIGQLFNFLLNYDIEPFDLRKAPMSKALQDQILESLPNEAEWFQKVLEDGEMSDGKQVFRFDGVKKIPKSSFFDSYIDFCNDMSIAGFDRKSPRALGRYLSVTLAVVKDGGKVQITGGSRANCYETQPLEVMQSIFDEHYKYQE